MWSANRANAGFTLIEILVTTALGLLLMGGALASYTALSGRQTQIQSAQEVQTLLRQAQTRSRAGDKPSTNCAQLDSYRVWGQTGTQNYAVAVRCDGLATDLETVSYQLLGNEYFLTGFDVAFSPLPGPVTGAPVTVVIGRLDNPDVRYEFTVLATGVVDQGAVVSE